MGVDVGSRTFEALLALLGGAPAGAAGVAEVHALTSCRPATLQIKPALVARNPRRLTRVEGMLSSIAARTADDKDARRVATCG
jgi:hypothetical protein